MQRGVGITCDLVTYSKSSHKYHVHLEVQPIRNDSGAIETFIAILADITARVETEQALRRAKVEADSASRAKSEFLASMSHEIRTPMNGVIGMTGLLLGTSLDPEQRDFVNTIRTSGESLLTIINDILDFSKIESGKMDLERLPFDLRGCVEDALGLLGTQAAVRRLDLAYFIEDDVPLLVEGDITRLRQILVNLVNNAVKFTPAGSITVCVRRLPPAGIAPRDQVMLEFTVADTGIGIPPDRLDRLFKPFSQLDSSTTRKYGGTGLGLAICHRLTHLMGGGIRVESELDRGSRFIFTLSTRAIAAGAPPPVNPLFELLHGRTVLGIEDQEVAQRWLAAFFHHCGARYVSATTAAAALAALKDQPQPALAVLDHDLLGTSMGPELVAHIEAEKLQTVVLLTPGQSSINPPWQRPHIVPLNKPVKHAPLLRCLQTALTAGRIPAAPLPLPAAEDHRLAEEIPLDVLLVEDNPVNQKVALRFLERLGYRARAVRNGLEAVSAVEAHAFDLVLMDLQMPELDGFEASRRIRARIPGDRQPKIVALTANALQGDRELCLAAGMDDYLTKPIKLGELSEVIRRQFSPPYLTQT